MRNEIGWFLLGLTTEEDVVAFINLPDNTGIKLRAEAERWKKLS